MTKVKGIFVNGRAYSGKDSVAEYISNNFLFNGKMVIQDSFAKPIYDICREYLDMKDKNRDYLIAVGQAMRDIDGDVWINHLIKRNKIGLDSGDYILLVSDVRQANEFIELSKIGFVSIRVKADLEVRIKRCELRDGFKPNKQTVWQWESEGETGADNFGYDYEVENNGTEQELYDKIDKIMIELGAKKKGEVF